MPTLKEIKKIFLIVSKIFINNAKLQSLFDFSEKIKFSYL